MSKNANLSIAPIGRILSENLSIPEYQRPYRWSVESVATLVVDTYAAFQCNLPEYRIGSVVLHKDGERYNIVDGQQRLTTLSIMMYYFAFREKDQSLISKCKLLEAKFNHLSAQAIVENFEILKRKCGEIDETQIEGYVEYILRNCTMVRIVTESEQEAFQFFDSQNSRGKALAPHDLLKSYHLREMNEENEEVKVKLINEWENTNQKFLENLFKENLFPLVRWFKYMDGVDYSFKDIKIFKGIRKSSSYNYAVYHRASHLYIEHYNEDGMYELVSGRKLTQFQLTQPVISGKRFFLYTLYYKDLYMEIENLIKSKFLDDEIPSSGTGDRYIRTLFINVVMFYVDKFGMNALTDVRLNFLYKWSYSLRLVMKAVRKESVNRYAQGSSMSRVNKGLNMFSRISEMQEANELDIITLDRVETADMQNAKVNISRYECIWERLFGA